VTTTDRYAAIIEEVLEVERQEAERQEAEVYSKPRPPADDDAIAAAEKARGREFSAPYRAFLKACNGWEAFSWGISLYGTDDLSGEAYDWAEEVLSYSEDVEEELEKSLLIGKNENDATIIMLLDSGEVVDFLYEETGRFEDLAAYLLSRKTTLLRMRDRAHEAASRTEREWDPEFRKSDDAGLAEELREVAKGAGTPPPRGEPAGDLASLEDGEAGPTPSPTDLVAKNEDGEIVAAVELGLILYLGAAPTEEETLETFRAFRRAFPVKGALQWSLADRMVFSMNEAEDPDSEPFADALRVDDAGFFGLRVLAGSEDSPYILNVRGIPAEEIYDDEDSDDEGEPRLERRASFVEVLVPASEDPQKIRQLCHELAEILPVRSGHGGWFARARGGDEDEAWAAIFEWCRRFFGIEPCYVDGWLGGALRRHGGAGWLTILGPPFVEALGDLDLGDDVSRHVGARATVLTAGEPTLGDVARGEFPTPIAQVARILDPISVTTWAKRGAITMGGVWFSTFSTQLPGAFNHHHATESFMRRFVDPAGFVGPSAKERALEIIERLRAGMDAEQIAAWEEHIDFDDLEYFRDVMQALFNGSYHTKDEALRFEALEHAARFPDWSPPATYNNLLNHYFGADRIDDAMAIMPVALETATRNPYTYHSAACCLVKAGRLDEAMDCVRRAKEAEYDHLDKLQVDDDLAPLMEREEWRTLFGG
jgi:pentatricopeptide repeat protein